MAGLRSGTASQTVSIATTDSSDSSAERNYKDDNGKRPVICEIAETERHYVKGLQKLVEPSAPSVNLITDVSSSKESVILHQRGKSSSVVLMPCFLKNPLY